MRSFRLAGSGSERYAQRRSTPIVSPSCTSTTPAAALPLMSSDGLTTSTGVRVGASRATGPAGVALSLFLARAGVPVTLLEAQRDFDRDFRGDTIHPATLEVLDQIGLA